MLGDNVDWVRNARASETPIRPAPTTIASHVVTFGARTSSTAEIGLAEGAGQRPPPARAEPVRFTVNRVLALGAPLTARPSDVYHAEIPPFRAAACTLAEVGR